MPVALINRSSQRGADASRTTLHELLPKVEGRDFGILVANPTLFFRPDPSQSLYTNQITYLVDTAIEVLMDLGAGKPQHMPTLTV
ncbi:MAG: hypothetical protein WDN24_18160 [Sphingomonas sp.]